MSYILIYIFYPVQCDSSVSLWRLSWWLVSTFTLCEFVFILHALYYYIHIYTMPAAGNTLDYNLWLKHGYFWLWSKNQIHKSHQLPCHNRLICWKAFRLVQLPVANVHAVRFFICILKRANKLSHHLCIHEVWS